MCVSVHTLECNLPLPPPPLHPEKADRSDATIIWVRLPDLLVDGRVTSVSLFRVKGWGWEGEVTFQSVDRHTHEC